MPNRIIKESICTSENIDRLSAFHETVFYRLIVNCDDFGRLDARPKILASRLFPLKDIRAGQIEDALRALTSAELVDIYEVDGKPFLQMKTWDRHQTIRAKKSKYPAPADGVKTSESICKQMQADDFNCNQMQANVPVIQSNPIRESNPNTNTKSAKRARFTPPTIEEVKAYAEERRSSVDPVKFFEYFQAGEWKDGKGNPVQNWKQKFITWEKFDSEKPAVAQGNKVQASCKPMAKNKLDQALQNMEFILNRNGGN